MVESQSIQPHIRHHGGVTPMDAPQRHTSVELEANGGFFDGPTYDHLFDSEAHEGARLLVSTMVKVYPFDTQNTLVRDFACGTGE